MHTKSASDPTIRLSQLSPLSINLGGMTMILGAPLYMWALLRFNLQAGQYVYIAVWACVAFLAYHLKRNRIAIDLTKREVSVQAYWWFFFDEEQVVYGIDTLHQKVNDTDSGRELVLFCPDGNQVAIYNEQTINEMSDIIPCESRPRN